ncbi:MAG TPA: hypothetical protein VEF53_12145 [Patescibacteria group bacterium]|nr:hypothetical protein [Patescibacteria group bacterium]
MLDKELLLQLEAYIEKYLDRLDFALQEPIGYFERSVCDSVQQTELEDFISNNRKPTFSQVLFSFIDKKEAIDSDVYKKAGIDRRHFSKIRSNPNYQPSKSTVLSLALALKLSKKETVKLLTSAGYSFSDSDTFDLVIKFFLERGIYDMNQINLALDHFSLKPIAGVLE